jgi:multiple antibiotic resistance protein
MKTLLLAFTALFSIVNPLSGAFIFYGATADIDDRGRAQLSRWVATYAFALVTASLYVGAYVLEFFGISIPVLKVAGGIVIAMSGWKMLTGPDATEQRRSEATSAIKDNASAQRLAFYPLTMPLTTGPGTISVAISVGAQRPEGFGEPWLSFVFQTVLAVALLCLAVYVLYRHSARIAQAIGPTGTTIVVRLSAFLLFAIGIQVLWNGAAQLLETLGRSVAS